jgi:hypothetical protein
MKPFGKNFAGWKMKDGRKRMEDVKLEKED